MTETNYNQLENFKIYEKKIEKSSVNAIAAFDQKYTKYTKVQFKNRNMLKVHPLNFEKVFNWIERTTWSELGEWISK